MESNKVEQCLSSQYKLSMETINESPPGDSHFATRPTSFQRLTILCANNVTVTIDYANDIAHNSFFMQTNTNTNQKIPIYLCHYSTRTFGEGSKYGSYFVNLETGEKFPSVSMSRWKGTVYISPDGNLLATEEGITASSATLISVYDISDLSNITLVYKEEFSDQPGYRNIHFNDKNEFVCTYIWDFWRYKDKISYRADYEHHDLYTKYVLDDFAKNHPEKNITKSYFDEPEDVGGYVVSTEKQSSENSLKMNQRQ